MHKLTLDLDDVTYGLLEQAAKAQGMSKSRWMALAIQDHFRGEWPQDCLELAGRFADFPLRNEPAQLTAAPPPP